MKDVQFTPQELDVAEQVEETSVLSDLEFIVEVVHSTPQNLVFNAAPAPVTANGAPAPRVSDRILAETCRHQHNARRGTDRGPCATDQRRNRGSDPASASRGHA